MFYPHNMLACSKRSHKWITTYELFCKLFCLLFGIMLLGFILLWHISVVWSFLCWIIFHCIPQFLYEVSHGWKPEPFLYLAIMMKALWTFLYRPFHGHIPLFLLCIFLGVGFGAHEEDLGLDLLKNACFLKWLC